MDLSHLSYQEQLELQRKMEEKQVMENMRIYLEIAEQCFNNCVNDFTTRTLLNREEQCVVKCTEKFILLSKRAGTRFGERHQKFLKKVQESQRQQQE
ncbi:uncharacterized protein VTP21DRAFT_5847 [Calcarisporiella thermophila]|uniref:uncharacterized protein n=1 Tax=Calcarisporiella thermophila TaxID=911321 RepID=UPI0037439139